jgi:hypothetical protein
MPLSIARYTHQFVGIDGLVTSPAQFFKRGDETIKPRTVRVCSGSMLGCQGNHTTFQTEDYLTVRLYADQLAKIPWYGHLPFRCYTHDLLSFE